MRAAAELMSKRGFQGTSAELIVRRARVGYATFYKHFADKEECLLTLFDATEECTEQALREAYLSEDPWPRKVAAVLAAFFERIAADPAVYRVCLVESLTAGPAAAARYGAMLRRFDPLLRPGRELNPRGDQLPPTLESTLASGVLWVAYQRLVRGEADQLAKILPETVEFVLSPYVGEEAAVRTADELLDSLAPASA